MDRHPGTVFLKTDKYRLGGVLSEKWVKKRVAKILVLSNNQVDIRHLILYRCAIVITTAHFLHR